MKIFLLLKVESSNLALVLADNEDEAICLATAVVSGHYICRGESSEFSEADRRPIAMLENDHGVSSSLGMIGLVPVPV